MKKVTALFLVLLMVMSLSVSIHASDFNVSDYKNPFTGDSYTEDSFCGHGVIKIILSHDASIKWREYTIEDFPELELESVYTHKPMSTDQEFIDSNSEYRNFVDITLKDKSDKAIVEAIELLYKRSQEYFDNNYDIPYQIGEFYMALPETKSSHEAIEPEYPFIDPINQKGSGDVNCDGRVNLNDASVMLKYIAGWKLDIFVTYYADVNKDDNINISDASCLLKKIAGWENIF